MTTDRPDPLNIRWRPREATAEELRKQAAATIARLHVSRAGHPWAGDDEGHSCTDCLDGGIYRCDRPSHVAPMDLLKEGPR
jgi:hypothetical protein